MAGGDVLSRVAQSRRKLEEAAAAAATAEPEDAVVFVGICLVLGIASRHLLRGSRVPYTVALFVLGIALGSLEYGTSHGLGKMGAGIHLWANINPDLLLAVFLPALLFESSFSMEIHQIKRCIAQMVLLAGPGVIISTFCLGTALKFAFPYNWDWKTSLLLGGLLSATDPVAVVALLKELGASKKLSTIIEGESLMNDGTAIVVYQLLYRMALGQSFSVGEIIKFLSQVSLGAIAVGLAFGIVSVLWLGFIFNDTVIEIALTLSVSYIAYFTAQNGAEVSGILTVMTLGMFYAAVARTAFKGDGQQSLHHFWEMVSYIANTLIFILSGVVIAEGILQNKDHFENHGLSWAYLILLYAFVQLSRAIVVVLLYPFLQYFGYGLDWKESMILIWSGLRGAVALSLALSRASDSQHSVDLKPEVGTLFVFFTGGIVFLTLIINGSTTQFLLHFLEMDKLSAAKIRVLNYTKYEMLNKALEAFGDLRDDEELGPADWPTVKKYITCLNDLNGGPEHPHNISQSEEHLNMMNLRDIRVRLLNGVQAAYWGMLEEGRITQGTAILLMQSVDEAMDLVPHEPLCDWRGLKTHVNFPSYYRFLQISRLPQRVVTYFTVERLESACYICAAFLRAHRIARRQLHEFIGESEIASSVIGESNAEGEEARKFLEDVGLSFPQVLRVVKTKQVTYSILKHLSSYVQNLEKVGLLEEKEMFHLDDVVHTDLKKLLRKPPLVKMPKAEELLGTHPLLGALPSTVRSPLRCSTKEVIKIRGMTLYKEGSKSSGVWLLSNGVVKWISNGLSNRHSLHPTFSHGSTLGLYEVLTGKPYICDMVADSVVRCFYIEGEKILSLLRSDPAVETFLWQESATVMAKLLLPLVFERMAMQELRALIAERSTMNVYIRGEIMELRQNSISFLLEGFIKAQDRQLDLIGPPAALLSPDADSGSLNLGSSEETRVDLFSGAGLDAAGRSCHRAHSYVVETRARAIVFEMAAFDPENIMQRQPSWVARPLDLPRSQSNEHGGLVSWPELVHGAKPRHVPAAEETGERAKSLSARAMELSFFGSTINGTYRRYGSFSRMTPSRGPSPHSLSFPRISATSPPPRGLVSTLSEGPSLGRKLRAAAARAFPPPPPPPPPLPLPPPANVGKDDSSDESGGEEVIVRIDSPSHIFSRASTS
ncbi:unnamed protein product [Spirodela intermedia]|uniref:Cyclic nucleotide-binding domain-containing protein n=1 Tax=Spirodela intermedia TaxID=51605 RepID=A0A7I8KV07_SPIIN|nr:unnamed protein product [Spirodela intermedia]